MSKTPNTQTITPINAKKSGPAAKKISKTTKKPVAKKTFSTKKKPVVQKATKPSAPKNAEAIAQKMLSEAQHTSEKAANIVNGYINQTASQYVEATEKALECKSLEDLITLQREWLGAQSESGSKAIESLTKLMHSYTGDCQEGLEELTNEAQKQANGWLS